MPAEAAARAKSGFASLTLLLVVVYINIAGFSLILPLLPFYGREFHASPFAVTLLFAAYSFGNIFGELYWGRLSDRIGRKTVLVTAIGGAALSYVAFAFAPSLAAALLIRIVSGFFSGTLGVCQSYIADVTAPEDRARSIGYFGAFFNLGFATGPAIGGLLAEPELGLAGFHRPILTAAALAAAAASAAARALKDTRAPGGARAMPHWGAAFRFVAAAPLLKRLFALAFIGIAAFASMEAVFGLWTARNFGWSTRAVGLTFIAIGATGMTIQLFLIGPLVRRFGEARIIVAGVTVIALSCLLQPITRTPATAVLLMSTLMAGHSLAFPNAGALVSRATSREAQGSVNGLLMASNALSRIVAPPLFGFAYAAIGSDSPYYLCALLAVAAIGIALQVVRLRDAELRVPQGIAA